MKNRNNGNFIPHLTDWTFDNDFFLGGLSLTGESANNLPRIDIYPVEDGNIPPLPEIDSALALYGFQWRRLRELVADVLRHNEQSGPRISRFPTLRGAVGVDAMDTFFIRFFYDSAKMTPLEALYELDARGLSRTVTGAVLAATKLELKYHPSPETYAPTGIAALCNEYGRWPALDAGGPRVGRRVLKQCADDAIRYLLSMTGGLDRYNHNMEIPYYDMVTNNIDVARLWIMVAQKLWQPDTQSLVAQSLRVLPEWSKLLALYGQVSLRKKTINVNGTKFRLYTQRPDKPTLGLWAQTLEWERHQTPANVIKYLSANNGVLPNLVEYWASCAPFTVNCAALESYDDDLISGLTQAFLHDAAVNGVYVPTGKFTVELPMGYPLRQMGTKALRVWAEPDRLIVSMIGIDGDIGPNVTWTPVNPFRYPLVDVMLFTGVTLAALWRDLRVAGETVFPPVGTRPRGERGRGRSHQRKRKRRKSVRTLPGRRYVRIAGNRQWGSDEEHSAIRRQAHGVRGHLRRLRPGWTSSEDAAATAGEFGMTIPDGFTFVRPHIRGEGHVDAPGNEVIVRSRGLASVMTLLGN